MGCASSLLQRRGRRRMQLTPSLADGHWQQNLRLSSSESDVGSPFEDHWHTSSKAQRREQGRLCWVPERRLACPAVQVVPGRPASHSLATRQAEVSCAPHRYRLPHRHVSSLWRSRERGSGPRPQLGHSLSCLPCSPLLFRLPFRPSARLLAPAQPPPPPREHHARPSPPLPVPAAAAAAGAMHRASAFRLLTAPGRPSHRPQLRRPPPAPVLGLPSTHLHRD